MATNKSVFPASIQYDGAVWHMAYDPSCAATVMPRFDDRDVVGVTCDPVRFPGRANPVWLMLVAVTIPSSRDSRGNIIGARRLIGFRTFDHQPSPAYRVQPNELVYYVAEQSNGSAAQLFFNAVTNQAEVEAEIATRPDTSWCQQFGATPEEGSDGTSG